MKLLAIAFITAVLLCACTDVPPPVVEDRYLSHDEDQALREACEPLEPFGGCVFMPRVQFDRMLRDLAKAKAGQNT